MSKETFFDREHWQIDRSVPINTNGTDKIVVPVLMGGQRFAAKIYRRFDAVYGEPIDRQQESKREYESYCAVSKCDLAPFVPKPIKIIQDPNGDEIGLLVEWRDGKTLEESRISIPKKHFEHLEAILLGLPEELQLLDDSFSESNVCWDGTSLWLAEPKLWHYSSQEKWLEKVRKDMKYLIDEYSKRFINRQFK